MGTRQYRVPTIYVLSRNMKNIRFFFSENFSFLVVKFSIYLNRLVFVMCSLFSTWLRVIPFRINFSSLQLSMPRVGRKTFLSILHIRIVYAFWSFVIVEPLPVNVWSDRYESH